jgi:hypothetical protein
MDTLRGITNLTESVTFNISGYSVNPGDTLRIEWIESGTL